MALLIHFATFTRLQGNPTQRLDLDAGRAEYEASYNYSV